MAKANTEFGGHGRRLAFVFGSERAAHHFKLWLCESGEQAYWDWMRTRETKEGGDITAVSFNYWTGTERVPTQLGRVSEDERDDA